MWDSVWPIVVAVLPTIGLLMIFGLVIWAIVNADRNEREAEAKMEAEHQRKHADKGD